MKLAVDGWPSTINGHCTDHRIAYGPLLEPLRTSLRMDHVSIADSMTWSVIILQKVREAVVLLL